MLFLEYYYQQKMTVINNGSTCFFMKKISWLLPLCKQFR